MGAHCTPGFGDVLAGQTFLQLRNDTANLDSGDRPFHTGAWWSDATVQADCDDDDDDVRLSVQLSVCNAVHCDSLGLFIHIFFWWAP